jgi:hypothetical protein
VPIGAAIGVAGVAGAGASVIGSNKAASAADKAATSNNALQAQIYDQNKQTLAPYVQSGNAATEQLRRLLGLGDSNTGVSVNGGPAYTADQQQQGAVAAFQNSAPYQAEFQSGQKAVTAALGAKGLLDSGAALKGLQSYGDQFLSSKLGTYEQQLSALGGQGLSAASAQAGVGQAYGNAVSANNNNAASEVGNAALGGANGINGALGNALSAYSFTQGRALGSSYGAGASVRNPTINLSNIEMPALSF